MQGETDVELDIELDTQGEATAGVDIRALRDNIQAELDRIADDAKVERAVQSETPPPPGAQGDIASFHWLLHLLGEPGAIKIYAKAAVFGINELVRAARRPDEERDAAPSTLRVRIKGLSKDLVLPAAEAVIQAALDEVRGA